MDSTPVTKRLLTAIFACATLSASVVAAGERDTGSRGRSTALEPRNPPLIRPRDLTSRPLPPRPRLWEGVEAAVDRGNGRVTDEPTYQVERVGRRQPQGEFERFQEEYDRRQRLDRQRPRPTGLTPRDVSAPARIEPSNVGLSRMLEEDERRLRALRAEYDAARRAAAAQRDRALAAESTELGRVAANRNYEAKRTRLTEAYQAQRQAVLGQTARPNSAGAK